MARRSGQVAGETTTRERILDVALDLFVRKGYGETSLREIAAELGFTKAALYYHFESKQDILVALHMRVHELTDDLLVPPAAGDDAWDRVVDRLIDLAMRNRRLLVLHLRNSDAIGELHQGEGLARHGRPERPLDQQVLALIRDPSLPVEQRVRRTASLGAVAGVLLAAGLLEDIPEAELEGALRGVLRDLTPGPG